MFKLRDSRLLFNNVCRKADWGFHKNFCNDLRKTSVKSAAKALDMSARQIKAAKGFHGHAVCCSHGYTQFHRGENLIRVDRDEKKILVCESCLARLGVTNRERVNIAHCRADQ